MSADAHHHGPGHDDRAQAELADILDMDADLLGGYLVEAADWTARLLDRRPRLIVDLGAGTGAGSLALARHFPDAEIVALDRSRSMLDRVAAAAAEAGSADRITLLQVDLDDGWPAIQAADIVWASSSLHEIGDASRVMRAVHDALLPGGLFVVIEMDTLPRFLPESVGEGVETRVHEVLTRQGWNHHPDWTSHLQQAGFEIAGRRHLPTEADLAHPGAAGYADTYLRHLRSAAYDQLSGDDRAALDRLFEAGSPQNLVHRKDLQIRGSRSAWAARRSGR